MKARAPFRPAALALAGVLTLAAVLTLSTATAAAAQTENAQTENAQTENAAPTLVELVERHLEARGGLERLQAIDRLEITGTYTAFSDVAPFTLQRQRPDLYRFETQLLGTPVVEAFDGEQPWWHNPPFGAPAPGPMPPIEAQVTRLDAPFDDPLLHWYTRREGPGSDGPNAELVGKTEVDGQPVWEIRLTHPRSVFPPVAELLPEPAEAGGEDAAAPEDPLADFGRITVYLDADSLLEVRREDWGVESGRLHERLMTFDDHRPVDGVVFPFYMDAEYFMRYRSWEVDEIRLDPDLPEGTFRMPEAEAATADTE